LGRKWIFVGSLVVQLAANLIIMWSKSLVLTSAMMAVGGFVTTGRVAVGYVYMTEFLNPNFTFWAAIIFNMYDGSTYLWLTLYFDWINQHYFYVALVGIVETIICIVGTAIFVPESPLFLLKSGKYERGKNILYSILEFNKADCKDLIDEIENDPLEGEVLDSEMKQNLIIEGVGDSSGITDLS
jgi:MFS family permease